MWIENVESDIATDICPSLYYIILYYIILYYIILYYITQVPDKMRMRCKGLR